MPTSSRQRRRSTSSWFQRVVGSTRVPLFGPTTISPLAISRVIASLRDVRLTPNSAQSSASGGSTSPAS
jgi:hypothetical protein